MTEQAEEENGAWRQKQVLGQGGFGCVSLWQNTATNSQIAIKKCRIKDDMPEKMWERWKMEVYIMGKLNHDNVIRAVELPKEMAPAPNEPPILAMEFCEGGDLRKVLTKPENVCGLRETEIRQLVTGIGSAIEYLHSNRIIHRDLKPENVVLKHLEDNKILYKIIDLGYAKEWDINSICDSFVGTVQYLAPELFVTKPYSKTVDYWSFGSLVFECIAGFRPFLPTVPPVEWHAEVCKKSPDDISAQYDDNRQIKFSKKLPYPNQLCKPLQGYFEQWLRLMLRWDPKARGGGIIQVPGGERPKCFYLLEQIMALKIVHIFYVEANTVLSYPVNETHTIADVHSAIEKETNLPYDEQDIVLANGVHLEPNDLAIQGCCESNSDDLIVFLFRRGPMQPQLRKNKKLPPTVQAIVKEPGTLLPQKEHRKAWAQAVYWCVEQNTDYKRLILSHRAALLNLLRSNALLCKQKTQMTSEAGKLQACKEQFQTSLDFDLQQYRDTVDALGAAFNGMGAEMLPQWTDMVQTIESFNALNERVQSIDCKATALTTEIVELQKSPFGKPKQVNELEDYEKKAKSLYEELQRATQGDRSHEITDHYRIVELVGKCYMERDKVTKLLDRHLSKVLDCQHRLEQVQPELVMACKEIDAARRQLVSMQRQRQADVWRLLGRSMNNMNLGTRINCDEVSSESTLTAMSSTSLAHNVPSQDSSLFSTLESMRLMDDCKTNTQRLQEMVNTMIKEQEESIMYFSSLDSTR